MAYQRFIYHGNIAGLLSALCHLTVSGLSDAAHGAATASNTVGKSNLSTCIAIVAELVLATCLPSTTWSTRRPRSWARQSASCWPPPRGATISSDIRIACWQRVHWSPRSGPQISPPSPRRRSNSALSRQQVISNGVWAVREPVHITHTLSPAVHRSRHQQLWPHLGAADKQWQRCGGPPGQCQYTDYNVRSQLAAMSYTCCTARGLWPVHMSNTWRKLTYFYMNLWSKFHWISTNLS